MALRSSEVVLISCYELGHQSFSIASAWAQLEREGHHVSAHDASLDALNVPSFAGADLVAISVPMHTALRLGVELAKTLREHNPSAHICLFGLYAWMHAGELLDSVADSVIGGEFESSLTEIATRLASGSPLAGIAGVSLRAGDGCRKIAPPRLDRIDWVKPRRAGLPPLDRYAKLLGPARGETRLVGYVEASRGCKHRCRHCPVVPVYDGRFVLVPSAVVLDDIEQQVAAGARHVTFGDPDFFNAPRHAREILRALHTAHPDLTFDLTTKVEHLLRERDFLPELARLGCLFVVSALESLSDRVLSELDKGHTQADILVALDLLRAARIELRPSFVPFTPWATLDDYIELVDFIVDHDLVENVDPIQLAIRLLVPKGSALLWPRTGARRPAGTAAELAAAGSLVIDAPSWLGPYDSDAVGYRWQHEDARMDQLFERVTRLVERGQAEGSDQRALIAGVRDLAYAAASLPSPSQLPPANERFVSRLSESWFCCAEPSGEQMARLDAGRCRSESSCQRQ